MSQTSRSGWEVSNAQEIRMRCGWSRTTQPRSTIFKTRSKLITRPAALVKQGDLILYATSLKVSDLLIDKFYSVETLDPDNLNDRGYQRLLNTGHAKKLADYIVAGQDMIFL